MYIKTILLISLLMTSSCAQLSSDLYWKKIVDDSHRSQVSILESIKKTNVNLYNQIIHDSKNPDLVLFWGESINFDSGAKKKIVEDEILKDLQNPFGIVNDNNIVHAGITHTYGYLFSLIETPYGYKRKRWIDSSINDAFSFNKKSLSPDTNEGGLLSNVTYFAGSLAYKNNDQRLKLKKLNNVSAEVLNFNYEKIPKEVLEEKISTLPLSEYVLRTTLIKFPIITDVKENSYLLIYSILNLKNESEALITMFPISKNAYEALINPSGLGPDKTITVKYNAHLINANTQSLKANRILIKIN
jgi:hypothetical protein